jgi:Zn-finger nucleic acid-binding protein
MIQGRSLLLAVTARIVISSLGQDTKKARVYRCPACGGDADEQARSCRFCSAAIATVRCAGCFHMNSAEAVHCSGCGRQLGLEPVGVMANLTCPDCRTPCQAFGHESPGVLYDCLRCGGQFIEHALLADLLERREVLGRAVPHHLPPENPLKQPVRYLPCPACGQMMNRKNFGTTSGIIVDHCHKHGMWFDPGELPRVLAFVQSGGLERARQREREEQRARQARERAERSAVLAPPSGAGFMASREASDLTLFGDLADAAGALLGFVRDLISH